MTAISLKTNDMKKLLLSVLSIFIVHSAIVAQVRLEWKTAAGKPMYYQAVLDVASTSSFSIGEKDLPEKVISEQAARNFLDLFGKKPSYVVMKRQPKNIIDVKISQRLEDSGMDEKTVAMVKEELGLEENVLLRGAVFSDGGIYTYFLENQQKSLLAAAFELPKKAVSKGDVWAIDFSCLDIKGVIITDTIARNILVKAEDIETLQGDTIVTISYDLTEFMQGKTQIGKDKFKPLGFDVKYLGRGKFSSNQGKWLEYDAVFTLEAAGMMTGKMKGIFSMRPVEDVPASFKQ